MATTDEQIKSRVQTMINRKTETKPLTACDVRAMTGVMDENVIHMILASGASRRDILQACEECEDLRHIKPSLKRPANERVRMLHDLIHCSKDGLE